MLILGPRCIQNKFSSLTAQCMFQDYWSSIFRWFNKNIKPFQWIVTIWIYPTGAIGSTVFQMWNHKGFPLGTSTSHGLSPGHPQRRLNNNERSRGLPEMDHRDPKTLAVSCCDCLDLFSCCYYFHLCLYFEHIQVKLRSSRHSYFACRHPRGGTWSWGAFLSMEIH